MMREQISYAMRNHDATQALIYFNPPSALKDWSFLAIELMVLAGFLLALVHAIGFYRKQGSPSALLTLLGCFLYGLLCDITSYYTVENFWHGEFSVMFLYNRLPLYIALLYPAFIYHVYMTIRRFDFPPLIEAVSVGFFGGLAYLIFDNLGPMCEWWVWDVNSPTTLPYLNNVPMTSYHWFFTFTAAFALICRHVCWNWVGNGKRKRMIAIGMVLLPILTCLVGTLFFIPYNIIAAKLSLGAAAAFHAMAFFVAGLLLLFNLHKPVAARDKLLMLFPLLWVVGHLYIYVAKFDLFFTVNSQGLVAGGAAMGNLLAVVMAMIGSLALLLYAHPPEQR